MIRRALRAVALWAAPHGPGCRCPRHGGPAAPTMPAVPPGPSSAPRGGTYAITYAGNTAVPDRDRGVWHRITRVGPIPSDEGTDHFYIAACTAAIPLGTANVGDLPEWPEPRCPRCPVG